MQRELSQTKDALTEANTLVNTAEASVMLLETSVARYKVNVSRLTTALAASKASVVRSAMDSARQSVYNINSPTYEAPQPDLCVD